MRGPRQHDNTQDDDKVRAGRMRTPHAHSTRWTHHCTACRATAGTTPRSLSTQARQSRLAPSRTSPVGSSEWQAAACEHESRVCGQRARVSEDIDVAVAHALDGLAGRARTVCDMSVCHPPTHTHSLSLFSTCCTRLCVRVQQRLRDNCPKETLHHATPPQTERGPFITQATTAFHASAARFTRSCHRSSWRTDMFGTWVLCKASELDQAQVCVPWRHKWLGMRGY